MLSSKLSTISKEVQELESKISKLEKENSSMRKAFTDLFSEKDIQMVPGYQLLKTVYSSYFSEKGESISTNKELTKPAVFDPFFAPPGMRNKIKPVKKKKKQEIKKEPEQEPEKCLLDDTPKKEYENIKVKGVDLYVISLQGKKYYLHNNKLYDYGTKEYFKTIEEMDIPKRPKVDLKSATEGYFKDSEDRVFKILDDKYCLECGEIENGEIMIY